MIYHYLSHSLAYLIAFFDEIADELKICLQSLLHEHASGWGRSDTLLVGVGGSSVTRLTLQGKHGTDANNAAG